MPSVLMASATTGSMYMAKGGSVLIGILIMLCVSVLFGLINGLAIAKAKMVPFIVTLSTMVVAEGFQRHDNKCKKCIRATGKFPCFRTENWNHSAFGNCIFCIGNYCPFIFKEDKTWTSLLHGRIK